jgi:hypothetical protein
MVRLFHPRRDLWPDHFAWIGPHIVGLMPTGRATVNVLQLNRLEAALVRQALMEECLFFAKHD